MNNGCSPNARFVNLGLRDSSTDMVIVESLCTTPALTEVLVSYGCVHDNGDTIVICNCGASSCCGVIWARTTQGSKFVVRC